MSEQLDYNLHVFKYPDLASPVQQAIRFFSGTPVHPLPLSRFSGSGVYALYYTGDFPPYASLAERNRNSLDLPIYVGKAVPQGSRKGLVDPDKYKTSDALYRRLNDHTKSIASAGNIALADFTACRVKLRPFRGSRHPQRGRATPCSAMPS